ncbi:MAG: hypothetical protein BMS9Abin06_1041 [Gammaproteobacteria bacterium]|nr:MAG: hypothetical protein BMS9Abin06_1041 [Gammaproteobacteria bacterium]
MELALKRLVILDVNELPIVRNWYIMHRTGKRLSVVAQGFRDFVCEESVQILNLLPFRAGRVFRIILPVEVRHEFPAQYRWPETGLPPDSCSVPSCGRVVRGVFHTDEVSPGGD